MFVAGTSPSIWIDLGKSESGTALQRGEGRDAEVQTELEKAARL